MRTTLDRKVFARIDEIHAAALRLRDELLVAAEQPNMATTVKPQTARMQQVDEIIRRNLGEIRAVCQGTGPEAALEDESMAGNTAELELLWNKVSRILWPPNPDDPAAALGAMRACAAELDQMVSTCMGLRLTPQINDVLENLEVGQPMDIEFVFGRYFPRDPQLRQRLVLEVAQQRNVLKSALVDSANGVVYRLPPETERWKGYLWIPGLVILFGLLFAIVPEIKRWLPDWPFDAANREGIVVGYATWIAGAVLHILIAALRQSRSGATPAFAAMDNWALWISVKNRSILYGVAWIALGYLIMIFLNLQLDLDWKAMLFAGYSADSLTELFVQRFETAASAAVSTITARVKPTSEAAKGPA